MMSSVTPGPTPSLTPDPVPSLDVGRIAKDSEDAKVDEYDIYRNKKDRESGKPLKIENTPEFFAEARAYRTIHENKMNRALSDKERERIIDHYACVEGKDEKKIAAEVKQLEPKTTWRANDEQWIEEQVTKFKLARDYFNMLGEMGLSPPRKDWTEMTSDDFQTGIAAVAAAGTSDVRLFDMIMALRKLGIFDMDTLADYDVMKLQDVLLFIGFNHWSYTAAKIIGAAKRIKYVYEGVIPRDKKELLSFNGISRKIMMIWMVSTIYLL